MKVTKTTLTPKDHPTDIGWSFFSLLRLQRWS